MLCTDHTCIINNTSVMWRRSHHYNYKTHASPVEVNIGRGFHLGWVGGTDIVRVGELPGVGTYTLVGWVSYLGWMGT